jgi:hypothetical protein
MFLNLMKKNCEKLVNNSSWLFRKMFNSWLIIVVLKNSFIILFIEKLLKFIY